MATEPAKEPNALGGCLIMIILPVVGFFWLMGSCSSPSPSDSTYAEAPIDYCPGHERSVTVAKGEVDQIEADIEIAKDAISTKNPTAMRSYREMVAADLGLLPSEANGWRTVFVGRLSTAQNMLPDAQRSLDEAQRRYNAVCGSTH